MIKKKYLILSSTLLLVLLSSLFTTSYALTENEFKNTIYNYGVNVMNLTEEDAKQKVDNLNITSNVSQYFDNDNVGFFIWVKRVSRSYVLYFQVINKTGYTGTPTTKCIYTSNNLFWLPQDSFLKVGGQISGNTLYYQEFASPNPALSNTTIDYFGTELDIYTSNNVIQYPAGTWSNTISKDGPYLDAQFTYTYNPNFQNVTVQDLLAQDVQMKAITYSDVFYDNDYLCVFGDFDQLDHVYLAYYKYNRYSGQWEPYQWVSPYTNYEKEDNQIRLYFNGNYVANTIICLGFIPKTDDFYAQYAWFYLTGKNTSSAGGVISPTSYSGDNDVQQQINDNNLQEIKDTLTDDSEVDNMLAEFGSGDINTMANKFGLPSIPNPFSQFIETIFYGITDVLTLDGDVSLDFGFQGQHMYLKSSDFVTPTNAATVFISGFLTFVYVYYMIELGYRTLINIREFNLDKTGIGNHYGQAGDGLQADGSWRLL